MGSFVSGEGNGLKRGLEGFKEGNVTYVMSLIGAAFLAGFFYWAFGFDFHAVFSILYCH